MGEFRWLSCLDGITVVASGGGVFLSDCRDLPRGERQIHDDPLEKEMKDGDRIIVFKVLLPCGKFLFPVKKTLQGPENWKVSCKIELLLFGF